MQRPVDSQVDRRQAPEWVDRPERSNTPIIRFIAWVGLTLGRPVARLLLYPICLYFLAFSIRARSASLQYLSKVLGRKAGLSDSFRHYHTFASILLDRVFLLNDQFSRFDVSIHGVEVIDEMLAGGQGCVLLGAHLGSFEIGRSAGRARGQKVSMVMYEENARKVGAVLEAINPNLRMEIIALGRVDSRLKVEAALARGEIVGMLATGRGRGIVSCRTGSRLFHRADAHCHHAESTDCTDVRPLPGRQPVRDLYRAVSGAETKQWSGARSID
jgi:predicted LPLAT superfamily acyltransferase